MIDINLQQGLEVRWMADHMDSIPSFHTSKQKQLTAVPELQNLQLYQPFLKITLHVNRFQPKTEKIIAEKQAGFRAGRSTVEQIFNLKISARNTYSISRISAMFS